MAENHKVSCSNTGKSFKKAGDRWESNKGPRWRTVDPCRKVLLTVMLSSQLTDAWAIWTTLNTRPPEHAANFTGVSKSKPPRKVSPTLQLARYRWLSSLYYKTASCTETLNWGGGVRGGGMFPSYLSHLLGCQKHFNDGWWIPKDCSRGLSDWGRSGKT